MSTQERESFPAAVKAARGSTSQREFGIRIGTTEQAVGKWERGECIPTGVAVRRALEQVGVKCPAITRHAANV